jgi:hypothetical protein
MFKKTLCLNWRPIVGWPYEVSDQGDVRRSVQGGSPIAKAGRPLKPHADKDGYLCVTLCDMPRMQTFKVHTLVCCAFTGPPPEGMDQVRHLNGQPSDNSADNLCWGTALQNAADREVHGRHGHGENSARAVFTQAQVDALRADHKRASLGRQRVRRGWREEVAAAHGVSVHAIATICAGRGYN